VRQSAVNLLNNTRQLSYTLVHNTVVPLLCTTRSLPFRLLKIHRVKIRRHGPTGVLHEPAEEVQVLTTVLIDTRICTC
jgi:hypothetical protein